ncbi:MAG: TPM domain-containing protein [Eubacteriales bacterium]|nr:TPM domain-containing protein [Eubacteriales bacterium]
MVKGKTLRFQKKILVIMAVSLVLLLLFFQWQVSAAENQVFDDAGLFASAERQMLETQTDALRSEHGMNFLVLTIEDAEGMSSEEYADSYYEDHGYADDRYHGGILILVDMDNREIYICTDRDMIYYMTDDHVESVLDTGYEYISDGEYAQGVRKMLDQVDGIIDQGLDESHYMIDRDTGKIVHYRSLTGMEILISLVISLAVAGAACMSVYLRYSRVHRYEYAVEQNTQMKFRRRDEHLINQFVTRRRIPKNPPPSSHGTGGGGSTVHRSAGGHTFGGGGRKF